MYREAITSQLLIIGSASVIGFAFLLTFCIIKLDKFKLVSLWKICAFFFIVDVITCLLLNTYLHDKYQDTYRIIMEKVPDGAPKSIFIFDAIVFLFIYLHGKAVKAHPAIIFNLCFIVIICNCVGYLPYPEETIFNRYVLSLFSFFVMYLCIKYENFTLGLIISFYLSIFQDPYFSSFAVLFLFSAIPIIRENKMKLNLEEF